MQVTRGTPAKANMIIYTMVLTKKYDKPILYSQYNVINGKIFIFTGVHVDLAGLF